MTGARLFPGNKVPRNSKNKGFYFELLYKILEGNKNRKSQFVAQLFIVIIFL